MSRQPTSPVGSFSTLGGSRPPSMTPNLSTSIISDPFASSTSLSVTTGSPSTHPHEAADGFKNIGSSSPKALQARSSPNLSPESTTHFLYSAKRNSTLESQNSSLESVTNEAAKVDLPLKGLEPAFSMSPSSNKDGIDVFGPIAKPLRTISRPQSIDPYRPSMLRNVDNISIPDTMEPTDAPDGPSFPPSNRVQEATYRLMNSLGLTIPKDGKTARRKDKDISPFRAGTRQESPTTITSKRSTIPPELEAMILPDAAKGTSSKSSVVGICYQPNHSFSPQKGNGNYRLYRESSFSYLPDMEHVSEDDPMVSGLSSGTTITTDRNVLYRTSEPVYEPVTTDGLLPSIFLQAETTASPLVDPISTAIQPSNTITPILDQGRELSTNEESAFASRDADAYDRYQAPSVAPSPPQSSTSSSQPSTSSSSRGSNPFRSSITKMVRKPFSQSSHASRSSSSSQSSRRFTPHPGYGQARYVLPSQSQGLLSGMRTDIVNIVHSGKGRKKKSSS